MDVAVFYSADYDLALSGGSWRHGGPGMRGGGKQIGSCRIEFVTRRVLGVTGGMDDPAVIAALRGAGGAPDDRRRPRVWWVSARRWAGCRPKRATDPLFRYTGPDLDDDR